MEFYMAKHKVRVKKGSDDPYCKVANATGNEEQGE